MARQRLGVVLLVPQPLATEIDGVRRALGDGALARIAPHITLVPPVNVAERDLPRAFTLVRTAASTVAPLTLRIGPVATFAPVNPVAYLQVGGEPQVVEALERLRSSCLQGPLDRPSEHEFVPHVTVANELVGGPPRRGHHAAPDFSAETTIDRVHVLAELPGRVWRPVADAPLGERPGVVGRGSLPLELTITGRPDVEAAALLSFEEETAGLPFAVTARREGRGGGGGVGLVGPRRARGGRPGRRRRAPRPRVRSAPPGRAWWRWPGAATASSSEPAPPVAAAAARCWRAAGFRLLDGPADGARRWELSLAPSGADDADS